MEEARLATEVADRSLLFKTPISHSHILYSYILFPPKNLPISPVPVQFLINFGFNARANCCSLEMHLKIWCHMLIVYLVEE